MTDHRPGQDYLMCRGNELGVLAKRTYEMAPDRACRPSADQPPLLDDLVTDGEVLVHDTECLAFKDNVDVVVKGRAWAPRGQTATQLDAGVDIGGQKVRLRVSGDRQVVLRGDSIHFSPPQPFESIELGYKNAYGGVDQAARPVLDAQTVDLFKPLFQQDISSGSFAAYRRNTVGKGFVIAFSPRIDGLPLPNIEDPDDLLTPGRLVCGHPYKWHQQPLPAGVDWFSYRWFPRVAHTGMFNARQRPDAPRPEDAPLREVELGYVPADVFEVKELSDAISDRIMNGASPALILPRLRGDEDVTLHAMDPESRQVGLRLPGEVPALQIQPIREQARELKPHLSTVIIDRDRRRVTMIWTGRTRAQFPYGPDQLPAVRYSVRW
jgi:hypothetical protein